MRALPGLGDLLCTVPAFRALRAALPHAHITLLGMSLGRELVARFSRFMDSFIEFPGYPGIPEVEPQVRELPAFFADMHSRSFDLAIQMHGSGVTSNPFTVMLGALHTAGFYLPGNYCPDPDLFLPYPEDEPEIRRNLRLLEFLGIPSRGDELEFPVFDEDRQALLSIPEARDLKPGEYVCIHPGAKDTARRWLPGQFALVADYLARRGQRVVLTGTEGEASLTRAVCDAMRERAACIDLAGRTNLGALAALLKDARLLVCNDTGVSHLAAALRVPSVVIFTASDPVRWAPLDRARHRVVGLPDRECAPAVAVPSAPFAPPVLARATPEEVLVHAGDLLTEGLHAAR